MKTILSTAAFVLLATAALADEVPPPQPEVQQAGDSARQAEDCSNEVWQLCLHSQGKGIVVRLVSTEHR
ncbi:MULTISPECIES: hypothetical protein [Bradyrhizobium]|uniref:Peptidase n=1 Tax=Bradyrhizobium brasilense TaxID=1419277 RepID=A0ABY8J715_9BRAD|nr:MULTISPECIES: hypothetical protein [Bradyrhizobium]MCP1907868.1 hypothetical protein [Bradyrhizobium elkanii]MCP1834004.1 hypothetical protein [Bradyrhizobium sp. USDA 4545]MCP1853033.1 hypothetical protein [Bradyrhizobium sp. USDA 4541]MCP1918750.1 hypothetical protein [Bradyrhizobium sp. USDA 4532]WFU61202.1 hypothetical protein QA636_27195 [Bradyrhizobium brasilense]